MQRAPTFEPEVVREIELRQDEVLKQLDELNLKLEKALADWQLAAAVQSGCAAGNGTS
jgi:hypothetical protein